MVAYGVTVAEPVEAEPYVCTAKVLLFVPVLPSAGEVIDALTTVKDDTATVTEITLTENVPVLLPSAGSVRITSPTLD